MTFHNMKEMESDGMKEMLMSNTKTNVVFGETSHEDTEAWVKEFGTEKRYSWSTNWTPGKEEDAEHNTKSNAKLAEEPFFESYEFQRMSYRQVRYKSLDARGKLVRGSGEIDFVADRHKVKHEPSKLDFEKFLLAVDSNGKSAATVPHDEIDYDPIKQDNLDRADLDPEDAISIPLEDKKERRKRKKATSDNNS